MTSPFSTFFGTLSVQDPTFGAIGDNSHDDTTAIQACFNAAFGTAANPHGNAGGGATSPRNKSVYFPPGVYKTTSPIVGTAIWGGRIFGAGSLDSVIAFQPSVITPVNTAVYFTVTAANATIGATYTNSGKTFTVAKTITGNTTLIAQPSAGNPASSGTLTKTSGTGDATITYSAFATENFCPVLWMNGCNFSIISGLSLVGPADATNHLTAGIWWGPDGVNGGSSAHSNTIINVATETTSYGMLHGSISSAANSENTYIGCTMGPHEIGMYLSGANTLNIRMYGGAVGGNTIAGIETNNSATMAIISNVATDNNYLDFDLAASSSTIIEGVRSESYSFLKTNAASTALINCSQAAQGGTITGSTSSTTLTVTTIATGLAGGIKPGMVIYGTDGVNSIPQATPTRILSQLTGSSGGTGTYLLSAAASPGNIGAGTTMTIRPVFCEVVGSGSVIMDGCGSPYDPTILGNANSTIRIRNNQFFDQVISHAVSPDLFKFYTGFILEYDITCLGSFTIANLPVANARFKGVRMFVTDCNITASGNYAVDVSGHGSGANTVPVWCDGSAWRIG